MAPKLQHSLRAGPLFGLALFLSSTLGAQETVAVRAPLVEPLEATVSHAHFLGRVRPQRQGSLAFEEGGILAEVRIDEGQRAAEGEVLARLEDPDLAAQLQAATARIDLQRAQLEELEAGPRQEVKEAASARLRAARAEAREAREEAERQDRLAKTGATTTQAQDRARRAQEAARARVQEAENHLEELERGARPEALAAQRARLETETAQRAALLVRQRRRLLLAPYHVVVTQRHRDPGAFLTPGTPLLEVFEPEPLEARVHLPGGLAQKLARGEARWSLLGSDRSPLRARFLRLVPRMDGLTASVPVLFQVEPGQPQAVVDDWVRLGVEVPFVQAGSWLPRSALRIGLRGLWSLYLLRPVDEGLHEVARIPAEILLSEGDQVYVRIPLEGPARILTEGLHRVVPGQRVEVLPP